MIDLHMHSYYSDGIYSPSELAKKAKLAGFSIVSLTDHNGIDGVKEFLTKAKQIGLKAISGVEIYTHFQDRHFHVLGYGFDLKNKDLNANLKKLQIQRFPRMKKAVKILKSDGWELTQKEVLNTVSSYPGLVHLANPLKKHYKNWQRIKKDFNWFPGKIIPTTEIIAKYFFKKDVSFYKSQSICPETTIQFDLAVKLIKKAGGQAVLAHPGEQLSWREDDLIKSFKKMGLDGIEAISPHHSWQGTEHWQKVAKELGLIITVGSDFHGYLPKEWEFPVRSQWDYFKVLKNTEVGPL